MVRALHLLKTPPVVIVGNVGKVNNYGSVRLLVALSHLHALRRGSCKNTTTTLTNVHVKHSGVDAHNAQHTPLSASVVGVPGIFCPPPMLLALNSVQFDGEYGAAADGTPYAEKVYA